MLRKLLNCFGARPGLPAVASIPASDDESLSRCEGQVTPRPAVLAGAFQPGYVGQAGEHRYPLRVMDLGDIDLPSGRLALFDPFYLGAGMSVQTLAMEVEPGRYPVDLAFADTGSGGVRVALARIRFSDAPVAEWRMAHAAGEDPASLRGAAIFGYDVDSGTGAFADPEALRWAEAQLGDDTDDGLLDRWQEEGEANAVRAGIPHRFILRAEAGTAQIAMFSSGWGDGSYASWLGYDAAGAPAQVVTDFAVIEAVDIPEA